MISSKNCMKQMRKGMFRYNAVISCIKNRLGFFCPCANEWQLRATRVLTLCVILYRNAKRSTLFVMIKFRHDFAAHIWTMPLGGSLTPA